MNTIFITPKVLELAAETLCSMRGVSPDDRPNESSPTFKSLCVAEILSALEVTTAIHFAIQDLMHTGKPASPGAEELQ